MLEITIPETEGWDENAECFVSYKEQTLQLEHSLVSISKWESKWCKSFFAKDGKTTEETLDYIKCMTITPHVDPNVYQRITKSNVEEINKYIEAPMTATTFSKDSNSRPNRERITSELIYYWMIALNIPFECQKWHINRLLTLIRVCNIKNQPPKKMSRQAIMRRNASLHAARRSQLNSRG